MIETTTTQAVVDKSKVTAEPVTTDDSARNTGDDLDKLLADFDHGTTTTVPASTQPKTETQPQIQQPDHDVAYIKQHFLREEMAKTITAVRGDLDPEVFDDDMVEGWLNARAMKDPRLSQAYLQRNQNPQAWAKVQQELGKQLSKKGERMIDRGATEDSIAVAASLRGASTKATAEPPPNLGRMNDAEFRKYTRDNFGF